MEVYNHLQEEEQGKRADQRSFSTDMTVAAIAIIILIYTFIQLFNL